MTNWIHDAMHKKGALHHQLGYPTSKDIPPGLLNEIYGANIGTHVRGHTVTPKLKHRAIFAVNAQKRKG